MYFNFLHRSNRLKQFECLNNTPMDKLSNLSPGRNSVRFNERVFIRDDSDTTTANDKNKEDMNSSNNIQKNLSCASNSSEYDNLNSNDGSLKIVS
jgi:hypothetical protein